MQAQGAQTATTVFTASPSPVWSSRTASRRPRASSTAASAKRCPSTCVSCAGAPGAAPSSACRYSCWSCARARRVAACAPRWRAAGRGLLPRTCDAPCHRLVRTQRPEWCAGSD